MTPKHSVARKRRIHYRAVKVIGKPVKVDFYTKAGEKVSFGGVKTEAHKLMPKKKTKNTTVKRVKAWALIWKEDSRLGMDSHGRADWDACYDVFTTRAYALREKKDATEEYNHCMKVVPCQITYSLKSLKKVKR